MIINKVSTFNPLRLMRLRGLKDLYNPMQSKKYILSKDL